MVSSGTNQQAKAVSATRDEDDADKAATVNRSRAGGGYGDEYAGHPGPEGYDAGHDADRYQDRADYHDFDAAYGDAYDDGAAYSYRDGYAQSGASGEEGYDEQGAYDGQGGYSEGRGYAEDDREARGSYEDDGYGDEDGDWDGGASGGGHDGYDGYEDDDEPELSNRILTIPNLISVARLAGVPLFLGLILSPYYGGPKYDVWALVVLALSGFSDWLDGKLARRWNQQTKFGAMLDPLADRLYILSTLVGFTMRGIIPLWLPIVLVGRDVAMLVLITPKLRKAGYGVALPVHFLGKAATFNLLYAFPLLLLGQIGEDHKQLMDIGNIFGWAFVGWGTALYLLAGGMYFVQAQQVTRATSSR
jgi:cardiolipin synthase